MVERQSSPITLDSSGSGTSQAQGTGGRREDGRFFNCHAEGDGIQCKWNSTYSDADKTIARGGDVMLSISGDTLTTSSTVDPQSLQEKWNTGRYSAAAERGGIAQYQRRR
jgi:hypothetical protein